MACYSGAGIVGATQLLSQAFNPVLQLPFCEVLSILCACFVLGRSGVLRSTKNVSVGGLAIIN